MGIHTTALLVELLGQIQSKELATAVIEPRLQKARLQKARFQKAQLQKVRQQRVVIEHSQLDMRSGVVAEEWVCLQISYNYEKGRICIASKFS
jgi:ABC-type phosphate transport system auxiliary subunit